MATQDLAYDPSGAVYQVFSISGTALGQDITGLTDYGTADNKVTWEPGSPDHFDTGNPYYHVAYYGLGFTLENGLSYDIYEDAGIQPPRWSCGGADFCLLGPNADPHYYGFNDPVTALTDFAVAAETPLPATLPLFASGLSALGFMAIRRKRKVASLAA